MDRRQRQSRAGFTLIEVLISILIVSMLVALLVPTVMAAIRKAREASVVAEMNSLATALADFKQKYGDYPPSRILLAEAGYGSLSQAFLNATVGSPTTVGPPYNQTPLADGNCSDMTNQQLMQRSQLYLSRFWPRVNFTAGGFDFNNNGEMTDVLLLSGSECLTFFLGGIPGSTGNGTYSVTGFSKSPVNPFLNNVQATNRSVPYYEFNVGRLIDQDGDHIPSYIDPINTVPGSRRSYAYFFSYGANAYDPNDVNGYGRSFDPNNPANDFEPDESGNGFAEWTFLVGFPTSANAVPYTATSPAPNPYTGIATATGNISWLNPNSFQIISCGVDGLWGTGGTYSSTTPGNVLPILPTSSGNVNGDTNRTAEYDNLGNFSGGRLN